jgi:hypothetical protein
VCIAESTRNCGVDEGAEAACAMLGHESRQTQTQKIARERGLISEANRMATPSTDGLSISRRQPIRDFTQGVGGREDRSRGTQQCRSYTDIGLVASGMAHHPTISPGTEGLLRLAG